jgi:NAD(P)-dependent dehydrogenase (short-subunit alcohol dehydrogenase family)
VTVDVTDRAGLEPALHRVESELGGIGILVNNAGNVSLSGGVLNEKPEDWDSVIETQLNAVFLLSKLAAKATVSRKSGKIINIGSMYSFFGSGLIPSYSAAKGAIVQLTKSMAIELAPHNIQVNAIAPGWIETDMTAPVKTMPLNDEILSRTPAGRWGVSRPAELHHRPLAEPSVRLSPHSAPIRQTCRSSGLSVARIEVLLLPVASVMRPPDPTPSLQPHYELSPLLRVGPSQCSASVRSPHGCGRLGFSLNIRATGSCSSAQQPASASRPLYAGRRPLSHQASRGLVPGGLYARGFDDTYFLNDASSKGSLSFVSRMLTCTSLYPRFSSNAHHHGSLPQQLGSVWDLLLKADPEGPSLIYCAACHAHGYLVHGELLIRVLLQHTQAEEVAGTAVYLASRASDFVTGTTIRIDGGYAIR